MLDAYWTKQSSISEKNISGFGVPMTLYIYTAKKYTFLLTIFRSSTYRLFRMCLARKNITLKNDPIWSNLDLTPSKVRLYGVIGSNERHLQYSKCRITQEICIVNIAWYSMITIFILQYYRYMRSFCDGFRLFAFLVQKFSVTGKVQRTNRAWLANSKGLTPKLNLANRKYEFQHSPNSFRVSLQVLLRFT